MQKVTISWGKAVPQFVKNLRDGLIVAVAGLLPFTAIISSWLHCTQLEYAAGSGIAIVAAKFLAKCCGVNDEVTIKAAAPNDAELNK